MMNEKMMDKNYDHINLSERLKTIIGKTSIWFPALASTLLVLPFILMELINRRSYDEDFPVQLFVILWLLPLFFFLILLPVTRAARAGRNLWERPPILLLRAVGLALIAWLWISTLIDQMDCFLGVRLCD